MHATVCAQCVCWINERCPALLPTEWQSNKDISCGPPAIDPTSPIIIRCLLETVKDSPQSDKKLPLSRVLGAKCWSADKKMARGRRYTWDQWTAFWEREITSSPLGTVEFKVESNGWRVKRQRQDHKSYRVTPCLHLNVDCQTRREIRIDNWIIHGVVEHARFQIFFMTQDDRSGKKKKSSRV